MCPLNRRNRIAIMNFLFFVFFCMKLLSQSIISERPFSYEDGIFQSDGFIVKFNENIIHLGEDRVQATSNDINIQCKTIDDYIEELNSELGLITFIKIYPNARWGDRYKWSKIKNKHCSISERAQIFYILFDHLVDVDPIIGKPE